MFSADEHRFMARALELAERGLFSTTPNPRVGCVIVSAGEIVGEGWHRRAGGPHAEVDALAVAGERSRGASAYVTLEPCSHFGRTPPCVSALVHAGITRVVAAMIDPNPLVAGKGFAALEAAGIDVVSGLMESEALALNIGYVSRMKLGRPWVRLKIAASLDGKTALKNGVSKWITSSQARQDAHRWRARSCVILTGIGTILADDPQMNVRDVETSRQPVKVVIDNRLEIPLHAKIFDQGETLVATVTEDSDKVGRLRDRGVQVIVLPSSSGKVDLHALSRELGKRQVNEILVEAGNNLNGALLRAGLVDEIVLYLAPLLLGDPARGLFAIPELNQLGEAQRLKIQDVCVIGPDIRIIARVDAHPVIQAQ